MHRIVSAVVFFLCVLACTRDTYAQCDSTPPQLQAAFTMHGDKAGAMFGLYMYVIHDTLSHAQLVVSSSGTEYAMRVYTRYASEKDTSYRCCLPYTEAHECHVTSSRYLDYVVHEFIQGSGDSIFLIPGSPEGIWSRNRQLLMTDAGYAQIVTGKFDTSSRDMIVIGNDHDGTRASNGRQGGKVSIWRGRDFELPLADIVIFGDTTENYTRNLGGVLAAADVDGSGMKTLLIESGFEGNYVEMKVFAPGIDFPYRVTRWRDRYAQQEWYYESFAPPGFADVTRDGINEMHVLAHVIHDTVWSVIRSEDQDFVYGGGNPFDSIPLLRWRSLDAPASVCMPNISAFGGPVVDLGDCNGDGEPDLAVGAGGSFGASGAVVFYIGGKYFDTLPDAYFVGVPGSGASQVVGGFDFNGDGLMDWAVPMFADDGVGGTAHPKGEVAFIAGSRTLRNIGVSGVRDGLTSVPIQNVLNIAPHPVKDIATLTLDGAAVMEVFNNSTRVEIVDMLGRIVASTPARSIVRGNHATIDCTGMPSGLYSVTINNNGHVFSKTFIHVH